MLNFYSFQGCGKTFVYNCVTYRALGKCSKEGEINRKQFLGTGKKVACLAWTGLATNLLREGRTIASYFKLDVNNECERSNMKPNSKEADKIRQTEIFVLDECSMISMKALKAINDVCQDIMNNQNNLFGGKTILLGGDFRQVIKTSPPRSEQLDQQLSNSKISCYLWEKGKTREKWPSLYHFQLTSGGENFFN